MSSVLPVFILSMILALISELISVYKVDENGGRIYLKRDWIIYGMMSIVLAAFAGLRVSGNDTSAYLHAYRLTNGSIDALSEMDLSLGNNPGYKITCIFLKMFHVSEQNFLMIFALITVCISLWFIGKYSENRAFSVFLYLSIGGYGLTFAAIKQSLAIAICLVATDRAIQKKWLSFVLLVLLASTFHPYSLMYLIVPFIEFSPWTKKTYGMLAIFAVAGISLQSMIGTIVEITSMMGEEYTASSFSGDGVNPFRLAVLWVPILLSFLVKRWLRESKDREKNVIINLAMLNAEIMFIALFGTANYFARLANYFVVFQTLALPSLFKYFTFSSKIILGGGAFLGYCFYLYYSYGIVYGGFDTIYRFISVLEYLRTAF